ncbi:uncharacterized protein VTP21DRAFT_2689 [Calcarisporiella thermophila]|uniref:uncharacterized protein n=1 Tax=Calcarisporiella thermophila TaxID=911321 RepID=UPI003741F82B
MNSTPRAHQDTKLGQSITKKRKHVVTDGEHPQNARHYIRERDKRYKHPPMASNTVNTLIPPSSHRSASSGNVDASGASEVSTKRPKNRDTKDAHYPSKRRRDNASNEKPNVGTKEIDTKSNASIERKGLKSTLTTESDEELKTMFVLGKQRSRTKQKQRRPEEKLEKSASHLNCIPTVRSVPAVAKRSLPWTSVQRLVPTNHWNKSAHRSELFLSSKPTHRNGTSKSVSKPANHPSRKNGTNRLKTQGAMFKAPSPQREVTELEPFDITSCEVSPLTITEEPPDSQTMLCPLCQESTPLSPSITLKLAHARKYPQNLTHIYATICRSHRAETSIVPDGIRRGYPSIIDFSELRVRVSGMLEDLQQIREESYFRRMALQLYTKFGRTKARQAGVLLENFHASLPGYYGPRGASIILDTLTRSLLHTRKLTFAQTSPQQPIEYLQQVLVPEVGVRLIMEDRGIDEEEARKVMKESAEFGACVHGDEEEWEEEKKM